MLAGARRRRRNAIKDRVVVRVNTMREVALSQVEPDALDPVQFRCVGWQAEQRHVGRHDKLMTGVPACTVQHHQSMFVGRQTGCGLRRNSFFAVVVTPAG